MPDKTSESSLEDDRTVQPGRADDQRARPLASAGDPKAMTVAATTVKMRELHDVRHRRHGAGSPCYCRSGRGAAEPLLAQREQVGVGHDVEDPPGVGELLGDRPRGPDRTAGAGESRVARRYQRAPSSSSSSKAFAATSSPRGGSRPAERRSGARPNGRPSGVLAVWSGNTPVRNRARSPRRRSTPGRSAAGTASSNPASCSGSSSLNRRRRQPRRVAVHVLPLTTWVYEPSSSTKKKRRSGSAEQLPQPIDPEHRHPPPRADPLVDVRHRRQPFADPVDGDGERQERRGGARSGRTPGPARTRPVPARARPARRPAGGPGAMSASSARSPDVRCCR